MKLNGDKADLRAVAGRLLYTGPDLSRHEHEFAGSSQAVDGEKQLVPRQIRAVTRHVFEVAGTGSATMSNT
jgi:hypothetical protein